jgi:hypothetical protein
MLCVGFLVMHTTLHAQILRAFTVPSRRSYSIKILYKVGVKGKVVPMLN